LCRSGRKVENRKKWVVGILPNRICKML